METRNTHFVRSSNLSNEKPSPLTWWIRIHQMNGWVMHTNGLGIGMKIKCGGSYNHLCPQPKLLCWSNGIPRFHRQPTLQPNPQIWRHQPLPPYTFSPLPNRRGTRRDLQIRGLDCLLPMTPPHISINRTKRFFHLHGESLYWWGNYEYENWNTHKKL